MIKFDFHNYVDSLIKKEDYDKLMDNKEKVLKQFKSSSMIGWTKRIDNNLVNKIIEVAENIKKNSDCLVVVGIGGSFLGSYAYSNMFKSYFLDDNFEVIFAGTTLSSQYMSELLNYLENKNFTLNVISKSGTTMETTLTYSLIKNLMIDKYSDEEMKKRIILTTDKEKGSLREEVIEKGYESFEIPNDIGGRYSFLTAAHLLPLAMNFNIKRIVEGYYDGGEYLDEAFEYAAIRNSLFKSGKYVENFCVYEENMYYFTEWLKQLFGETEGKNGVGILPMSTVQTRDLHSLGQFIQEGNKIIFETFIKVNKSNRVKCNLGDLHEINNIVLDSVVRAHYSGGVPCNIIELESVNEEDIASLIYFFQLAAAFSGYLMGIEPFDQPGVEVYKKEVREGLNK